MDAFEGTSLNDFYTEYSSVSSAVVAVWNYWMDIAADGVDGLEENVADGVDGLEENVADEVDGLEENVADGVDGLEENGAARLHGLSAVFALRTYPNSPAVSFRPWLDMCVGLRNWPEVVIVAEQRWNVAVDRSNLLVDHGCWVSTFSYL